MSALDESCPHGWHKHECPRCMDDPQPRQHVSDAAWERATWLSDFGREPLAGDLARDGLMLVTVEEWDAKRADLAVAYADNLLELSERHKSELAELQAANKLLSEQVEKLRARIERSKPVFPGTAAIERKRQALVTTPEPDRYGRLGASAALWWECNAE